MADSAAERTEEATPKRKQEARKKGTVAKSHDLVSALVMVAFLLSMPGALHSLATGWLEGMRYSLHHIPSDFNSANILGFAINCAKPALPGLGILVATAMGVGLFANFAQVGLVFSPQAMIPNPQKLNPFNGIKRFFSAQIAVEGTKTVLKTALFGYLAFGAIMANWDRISMLCILPPMAAVGVMGETLRTMAIRIVMAWVAMSGLDYFFQRKQIEKNLRMTKEEVKREMKEAETSPEVRQAMMARRRKMKRRMMDAVRSADVVVTNPTHFAVAIKYEPGKSYAPIVVAKGQDFIAAKIREEAKKYRVPLVANPPLARALYKQCEIGDFVPRELFQAVAELLAHVYKTLGRVRRNG